MGAFFVLSCYFKSIFARNLYFDFTPSDGFAATSLDPKEQRAFIYYHFERSEEFPPLTHNPCRGRLPPLPKGRGTIRRMVEGFNNVPQMHNPCLRYVASAIPYKYPVIPKQREESPTKWHKPFKGFCKLTNGSLYDIIYSLKVINGEC